MKHIQALLICVFSFVSPALAQTEQQTITLFSEIPTSPGQTEYIKTLSEALSAAGFPVAGGDMLVPVEQGKIRDIMRETEGALGIAYLQTLADEGNVSAALLSTPGAFPGFREHRAALQDVIGDAARSQLSDRGIVALRLWPHSTDMLVSSTQLTSLADFQGQKTVTGDPYSIAFFNNLGAAPMQMAFAEVIDGLSVGIADVSILPQDIIQDNRSEILTLFQDGTVIPEYKTRTAVTLASEDWWRSLNAGEQKQLFNALAVAEAAAASHVQRTTEQVQAQSREREINTVSWNTYDQTDLRDAVRFSISQNARANPDPILELHDDLARQQQALESSDDRTEPEQRAAQDQPARIFFVSNRRFDADQRDLINQFANTEDPDNTLRCGELTPPGPGRIGKISGDINLVAGSSIAESDACIGLISSAAHDADGKVLIQIHGYNNTFGNAVKTGLAFSRDTDSTGVVVIWSWPSGGGSADYFYDEESITISEPIFSSFAQALSASEKVNEVNFLAHSMGSRLLVKLMRDDWTGKPSTVALAAADVARPYLKQGIEKAKAAYITLLATEGDRALLASRTVHARTRAGLAKPLMLLDGMDTIDLTAFDHWWLLNHRHVFTEPEIISDLATLFAGKPTASSRGLTPHPSPGSDIEHFRIIPE